MGTIRALCFSALVSCSANSDDRWKALILMLQRRDGAMLSACTVREKEGGSGKDLFLYLSSQVRRASRRLDPTSR